ncbi:MAG: endonuclease domain-containing protein [Dehalococcoidia bacterium]
MWRTGACSPANGWCNSSPPAPLRAPAERGVCFRAVQTRPLRGNNVRAARRLRRELTATEATLWEALRDKRLNGLKFRRQHPVGRFVIDFYCADVGVAVEVDGDVHLSPVQRVADADRQRTLEDHGIQFLRFTNDAVQHRLNAVLSQISDACSARPAPPLRERAERGSGGEE